MTREENKLGERIAKLDDSRSFVDNFDSFVDFALFPFLANPAKEEWEHFNKHKDNQAYLDALLTLVELSEGYHDALGDMFMERISHGANSQFFTPEHICDMMAEIVGVKNDSVCDPTCGSGRFLLKGMQKSRDNGTEPELYGCDLDYRCVRMTLLNICLNSGRGNVEWGNTLMLEIYKTYHIDRVLVNGKWMSFVWQYSHDTDFEALNAERERTKQQLLECGILYELPRYRREKQPEPEDIQPEEEQKPAPVETKRPAEQTKEQPKAPVQLSFDF